MPYKPIDLPDDDLPDESSYDEDLDDDADDEDDEGLDDEEDDDGDDDDDDDVVAGGVVDDDDLDDDLDGDLDEDFALGDGTADTSAEVWCPYCGEESEIALDPGSGSTQQYVEDCPVCCRPWMVTVRYDATGGASVFCDADDTVDDDA